MANSATCMTSRPRRQRKNRPISGTRSTSIGPRWGKVMSAIVRSLVLVMNVMRVVISVRVMAFRLIFARRDRDVQPFLRRFAVRQHYRKIDDPVAAHRPLKRHHKDAILTLF